MTTFNFDNLADSQKEPCRPDPRKVYERLMTQHQDLKKHHTNLVNVIENSTSSLHDSISKEAIRGMLLELGMTVMRLAENEKICGNLLKEIEKLESEDNTI